MDNPISNPIPNPVLIPNPIPIPEEDPTQIIREDDYICSITQDIPIDPVITADGHLYDRTAISTWLRNHSTSPATNKDLINKSLITSIHLTNIIKSFWKKRGADYKRKLVPGSFIESGADIKYIIDKGLFTEILIYNNFHWNHHQKYFKEILKKAPLNVIEHVFNNLISPLDEDYVHIIHYVASKGLIEVMELLLGGINEKEDLEMPSRFGFNVDINTFDSDLWTPIHYASKDNSVESIEYLLNRGADIETPTTNLMTPLCVAAFHDSFDACKFLIEAGAKIEARTQKGSRALLMACSEGYVDIVTLLIEKGAIIDTDMDRGLSPLRIAITKKNLELAKALIELGCEINNPSDDTSYNSPLIEAVYVGDIQMVRLLVEKGMSTNGGLNLNARVNMNSKLKTKILNKNVHLPKGEKLFFKSIKQPNALHISILLHRREISQLLINSGFPLNEETGSGTTTLDLAVIINSSIFVKMLINGGIDMNKVTDGTTSLRRAVGFDRRTLVGLLLSHGADPMISSDIPLINCSNSSAMRRVIDNYNVHHIPKEATPEVIVSSSSSSVSSVSSVSSSSASISNSGLNSGTDSNETSIEAPNPPPLSYLVYPRGWISGP